MGLPRNHELHDRTPTELIEELQRDGLLIRVGDGDWEPLLFLHRTLHEYLAACALSEVANRQSWEKVAELIDRTVWLPGWEEVITIMAGLLGDPAPLLNMLKDTGADDLCRHRLGLAMRCLGEIPAEVRGRFRGLIDELTADGWDVYWGHLHRGSTAAIGGVCSGLGGLALVDGQVSPGLGVLQLVASLLADSDARVRACAARSVGQLGSGAATPTVLEHLLNCVLNPDQQSRESALDTIGKLGTAAATPAVLARLLVWLRDSVARDSAVRVLRKLGAAAATPEVVALLLGQLRDRDYSAASTAWRVFERFGTAALTPPVVTQLREWVTNDSDGDVRINAATTLGRLGPTSVTAEVITCLGEWVQAGSVDFRRTGAATLGGLGVTAATPVNVARLVQCLKDPDWYVIRNAVEALGRVGARTDRTVILRLVEMLQYEYSGSPVGWEPDEDWGSSAGWIIQKTAAEALGRLGAAAASEVLLPLAKCLFDPESNVRDSARGALAGLGRALLGASTAALLVTALLARLQEPGWHGRTSFWATETLPHGSDVLGCLGPAAATPEAVAWLLECLTHPDWLVRRRGADALGRLGSLASTQQVVTRLIGLRNDPVGSVGQSAIEAVGKLGAKAATSEVLAGLIECLVSPNFDMRSRSAEALGRLGKAAAKPDVVVRLSGCLLDRERQVRLAAARALGALGLDAATPEVVSRLRNWLEDPDEYIRGCAARALRQLMTAGARFFSGVKGINVVSVRLLAKTNPPWNIGVG